jgi:hypothetical protein
MMLSVIAVMLSVAVALGDWAAQIPWLSVLTVSVIALVAVWLCRALEVGPPGAYIFVVACAAGIGASAAHLTRLRIGLLVLAGADRSRPDALSDGDTTGDLLWSTCLLCCPSTWHSHGPTLRRRGR